MKLFSVETVLTLSPEEAAEFIRGGGVVAFPTETVYGLGADVFNEKALAKIFEAKRRPADNPLIAHIADADMIERLAAEISADARLLIDAFFPGPLTLVLKKNADVPDIATAGLDTIGVRMPAHPTARRFLAACATAVAAPSANVSGRPSPTTWEAVFEDLNDRIDCILQGDPTEIGLESTVVDCTTAPIRILRPGAISLEAMRNIVPNVAAVSDDVGSSPKSPGLKHKHYAPKARVVIVGPDSIFPDGETSAFIGLRAPDHNFRHVKLAGNVEEYAKGLFEFFRECDRRDIRQIYCESVPEEGIGAALMDRLRRAAEE